MGGVIPWGTFFVGGDNYAHFTIEPPGAITITANGSPVSFEIDPWGDALFSVYLGAGLVDIVITIT